MEIDNEHLFSNILKNELEDYLHITDTKLKKVDLQNQILDMIKNEKEDKRFLKTFEKETAIYPGQLEEILQCTKTERLRWQEEKKLKIVEKIPFKYGEFPIFSRYQIKYEITDDMLNQWREEYKSKKKSKDKTKQIKKANEIREKRAKIRKEIIYNLGEQKIIWATKDKMLCASFDLAYWTTWISRLAKTYQEKSICSYRKSSQYKEKQNECYQLKNNATFALSKSLYAKLSFYIPEQPHKYHFTLCPDHLERFRYERSFYGYGEFNVVDYFWQNEELILGCPHCECTVERDYYSLYYLEISDDDFGSFSFHTPYSLGKDFFGPYTKLPLVKHEEQEGMFRFGRSLSTNEENIFTHAFIMKQFNQAYDTFCNLIK